MGIENTSQRDSLLHVLGAMSVGSDDYIIGMERDGQRELVNSTDLPTDTHDRDEEFVALGFTFGQSHQRDPMFRPATLPEGWKREGSDHAMWSYIVDDKGRQRVAIFYKAAFYDRSAHMGLVHPTAPLSNLYYADEAPTSLPIDDLCTAAMAKAWIVQKMAHDAKYQKMFTEQDREDTASEYSDKLARLDLMLSLLPVEA